MDSEDWISVSRRRKYKHQDKPRAHTFTNPREASLSDIPTQNKLAEKRVNRDYVYNNEIDRRGALLSVAKRKSYAAENGSGRYGVSADDRPLPFSSTGPMYPMRVNVELERKETVLGNVSIPSDTSHIHPLKENSNLPDNLMFVMFVTENGNGYQNDFLQKIITFGYDKTSIENIYNILYLLNKKNTQNRKLLNICILDHDITILNFDYLSMYSKVVDYTETYIISIDVDTEHELSTILINIFTLMINDNNIIQVLYSRRKKYVDNKKMFFFLIKIFINKSKYSIEQIKNQILIKDIILKKKMKLKISDIDIDNNNKSEKGIRKNNWINI